MNISPITRISLGLVFITVSILLFGNLIGLVPDQSLVSMEARKTMAESLAVQCTLAVRNNTIAAVQETIDVLVESQPEILSLGLRGIGGEYLAQSSTHQKNWIAPKGEGSTPTHWQVPIFNNSVRWASLEISFAPRKFFAVLGYQVNPFHLLVIFFTCASFIGFFVFMKRTLRHLDPSAVMPSRVKKMLDTLTEGVIILDTDAHIILANTSFAHDTGHSAQSLMGLKVSELKWVNCKTKKTYELQPWNDAIAQKETLSNMEIGLLTKSKSVRIYQANFSPILDEKENCRGVLATFDDVTELKQSKQEVERQNVELEILATQDPLTGCLNRRAFFVKTEHHFRVARENGTALSCIMADLDKFKSVNDTYGHAVGDRVIKFFAKVLLAAVKGDDAVCRYGGEEFCVLLPNCDADNASLIAEKIRKRVQDQCSLDLADIPGFTITGSFGVSTLDLGVHDIEELVIKADQALYQAKEQGRNRVISWNPESGQDTN